MRIIQFLGYHLTSKQIHEFIIMNKILPVIRQIKKEDKEENLK
jgi:hypothetical protein